MFMFSNKAGFHFHLHQNDKIITADFLLLLKATQHQKKKMDCDSTFFLGKIEEERKK